MTSVEAGALETVRSSRLAGGSLGGLPQRQALDAAATGCMRLTGRSPLQDFFLGCAVSQPGVQLDWLLSPIPSLRVATGQAAA